MSFSVSRGQLILVMDEFFVGLFFAEFMLKLSTFVTLLDLLD